MHDYAKLDEVKKNLSYNINDMVENYRIKLMIFDDYFKISDKG